MEVSRAIETRIEVREYADESVEEATKGRIMEAGRLASSGKNTQHWRFVLVDEPDDLERLARVSPTGGWIAGADFAVVVVTDPTYEYHDLDAGRAITYMQLAAWEAGVGSCIYTGVDETGRRDLLGIPEDNAVSAVVGFGVPPVPVEDVVGRKDRVPLKEIAYDGTFEEQLERFD